MGSSRQAGCWSVCAHAQSVRACLKCVLRRALGGLPALPPSVLLMPLPHCPIRVPSPARAGALRGLCGHSHLHAVAGADGQAAGCDAAAGGAHVPQQVLTGPLELPVQCKVHPPLSMAAGRAPPHHHCCASPPMPPPLLVATNAATVASPPPSPPHSRPLQVLCG